MTHNLPVAKAYGYSLLPQWEPWLNQKEECWSQLWMPVHQLTQMEAAFLGISTTWRAATLYQQPNLWRKGNLLMQRIPRGRPPEKIRVRIMCLVQGWLLILEAIQSIMGVLVLVFIPETLVLQIKRIIMEVWINQRQDQKVSTWWRSCQISSKIQARGMWWLLWSLR